jgi:hypothetical protein
VSLRYEREDTIMSISDLPNQIKILQIKILKARCLPSAPPVRYLDTSQNIVTRAKITRAKITNLYLNVRN